PAGVYYNPDSRNFYDAKGVGMGWDFYIQWRECRDMFPKSRAAMSASVSEQLTPHDADIERLLDAADHAAPATQAADTDARDAARYRWLRDHSEPGICAFYLSVGQAFKNVKFARETVDDAIDAQIAAMSASASDADGSGKGGAA
ncbi:MAG TPA: hypothetical protein VFP33_06090, partial [Gallionella sp.]|nr:hypothetical protein [Gallionella sp.]